MTKSMTTTLRYDAPLEQVSAMLFDPEFRRLVNERQYAPDGTVEITTSGDVTVVSLSQTQPMDRAPGFVQKVVGSTLTIATTETWAGTPDQVPTSAQLAVDLTGKPVQMSGTITLSQEGSVTTETIDLTVKVSMPLIGGKAEEMIASIFTKAYAKEHAVAQQWLYEE